MQVSDFTFELPAHLIAKYPMADRSASRLLHLDAGTGKISHYHFSDLQQLLYADDLLVFNDTRVIPARLFATKLTGGKVEILLERVLDHCHALVQMRSSKALKPGAVVQLAGFAATHNYEVVVIGRQDSFYQVAFPEPGVLAIAQQLGHMPLPPYIDRADEVLDKSRYQTVYAARDGAVAAPTAGLHFDKALLKQIETQGVASTHITLHVGAGTFQPVRVDKVEEHLMHAEQIQVDQPAVDAVQQCRAKAGRVIAVGTTSVRSLESASASGLIKPYADDSKIFIYPGYEFKSVDAMVTNFHLSGSTLMMLVSAFAGLENIQRAYQTAIKEQYRFFSYGDAMLITR
ncbi:MAG: tRNA preQ1(34) S-adenosylmethionine ribosyltransferase-isomerase QueA [Pseudomonadales bacterium]|nr:tRNA preQ1(34) S-adenosylmethionine ribosyltransferase-isomerase QueA [Pseudomonadales bacterium]